MLKTALTALLLAALPLGAFAWCPGEGGSRSIHSEQPTSLVFVNAAESAEDVISVYWLDYDGNRRHYFDLYPGETRHQDTFLTHPWVVTFPQPGGGEVCHGIYNPLPGPGQIVIR